MKSLGYILLAMVIFSSLPYLFMSESEAFGRSLSDPRWAVIIEPILFLIAIGLITSGKEKEEQLTEEEEEYLNEREGDCPDPWYK